MTFEQKVHDTIMAILASAAMPTVSWDASDGSAFVGMTVNEGTTKLPTQAEANPVQYVTRPREARHTVGAYVDEIDRVVWQAHVVYPVRVSVDSLIENFSRTVAAEGGQRLFDLRLTDASVEHPPRNAPESGTYVSLQIEVHPAPV